MTAIAVDRGLCKACGICIALCPRNVFDKDDENRPLVARLDDCSSCSFCEWHCPDFAITLVWGVKRASVSRAAGRPRATRRRVAAGAAGGRSDTGARETYHELEGH